MKKIETVHSTTYTCTYTIKHSSANPRCTALAYSRPAVAGAVAIVTPRTCTRGKVTGRVVIVVVIVVVDTKITKSRYLTELQAQ